MVLFHYPACGAPQSGAREFFGSLQGHCPSLHQPRYLFWSANILHGGLLFNPKELRGTFPVPYARVIQDCIMQTSLRRTHNHTLLISSPEFLERSPPDSCHSHQHDQSQREPCRDTIPIISSMSAQTEHVKTISLAQIAHRVVIPTTKKWDQTFLPEGTPFIRQSIQHRHTLPT